ncbi:MAG: hypothetical protein JHC33_03425 [Ignisphaera sp.]|nr:hypothetical protein [Ignisphaera sp.]
MTPTQTHIEKATQRVIDREAILGTLTVEQLKERLIEEIALGFAYKDVIQELTDNSTYTHLINTKVKESLVELQSKVTDAMTTVLTLQAQIDAFSLTPEYAEIPDFIDTKLVTLANGNIVTVYKDCPEVILEGYNL